MKNRNRSQRIPLDLMEDVSSDGSSRSREQITETRFPDVRSDIPKSLHFRSYSMDTSVNDMRHTLRTLPSRNIKCLLETAIFYAPTFKTSPAREVISGKNTQSTFDLRSRKSSVASSHQTPRHAQSLDEQVEELFSVIEHDASLMEDNPLSEQMRIETLRKMPTSLTLKRSLKHRLGRSIRLNSKRSPLSLWKTIKYFISVYLSKLQMGIKDIFYIVNLWYGSIKTIEGHFGTSTATYFKFFRWLFLINTIVFMISFGFIVIPQLLLHLYEPAFELKKDNLQDRLTNNSEPGMEMATHSPYDANGIFSIGNLITGEGWLEKSELYYGFYSNKSLSLISNYKYSIPGSYIFTMTFCYILTFILVATSAAKSYRKSYIETGGGVKHVYSHKLFCGWDFGIATEEGAHLKRQSLYNEFKELLDEEAEKLEKECNPKSLLDSLTTFALQMFVNFIVVVILCSTGILIWILLSIHKTWEVAGNNAEAEGTTHPPTITVSLSITLILLLVPMFFSYVTRLERYQSPRTALYVTLWRTFGLEVVVLSVLLAFWLHSPDSKCWETSLGQEVYRLVVMDFLITICGKSAAELIRSRIYWSICSKIGLPEFDIAQNTLILIYNQTLFWIGFFFSPLLAFIIVLKMLITFYIKKVGVVSHCKPSSRAWRAAQTETIFLVLSFLSLFGVLFALGFAFSRVPASYCGPFRGYEFMYQMVLIDIFSISQESTIWNILSYSMRPGVVGCVLVSMCVGIYYVRAVAMARVKMVKILREMLVLEAKDKEYLLANIFSVTEGRYGNLPKGEYLEENSDAWKFHQGRETSNIEEDVGDITQSTNLEDSIEGDFWLNFGSHQSRSCKGIIRHKR